jgi:carbamoyltransferase
MKFLGLRLCDHDSNISYSDGKKIKYFKSERKYQIKHHGYENFFDFLQDIKHWNIDYKKLDAICICADSWNLKEKVFGDTNYQLLKENFLNISNCPIYFIEHHYAHKLSLWPLIETNKSETDYVFDGIGDFERTSTVFKKDVSLDYMTSPEEESIGRILCRIGKQIGLTGHDLDLSGKVMALMSYGNIDKSFVEQNKNYSLKDLKKIYDKTNWKNKNDFDWLTSTHYITENKFLEYFLKFSNRNDIITYSGGVAQNCVINYKLKNHFKNLIIPPHCNDDGLSLGCIELLRIIFNQENFNTDNFPYWQDDEEPNNIPNTETIEKISEFLAKGKIIGWYQGKGEIGPRALGNRSILLNPLIKNGKEILNEKIKKRETFRPYGASIIDNYTSDFFECDFLSEYMLYAVKIKNKDLFPSITHVDGTCRIQTVSNNKNEVYYNLLNSFFEKTGIPFLLNTSLNINGKPIASTMNDAIELFKNSDMDVLCLGNEIYKK